MTNYEKVNTNMPDPPNRLPYSDQQPQDAHPMGPVPPTGHGAAPPMPTQYQGYYMPPGAVPTDGPILQQPQVAYLTPLQPVNEPDHLIFSILTMLCCCLPLGIAALVFSVKTREANQAGNLTAAKKYSRQANKFAYIALSVGVFFLVLYTILVVLSSTTTIFRRTYRP